MQDNDKVPGKLMFILCTVILSEPVSLSILFPFVYFMVLEFGISPDNAGYYVGLLASSFSFAQLLTSYFWGWLSDRIGRRPVLLCGLIGTCLSSLMFGMSKSLAWAMTARIACGILNGNVGVAKCVLGEVTNNRNRGAAFAILGVNYGIGMIIGPSLGGLLSWPAKNYPWLFGECDFFINYPYFLPCACNSIICIFGFVSGYLFLPETATHLKDNENEEIVIDEAQIEPEFDRNETATELNEEKNCSLIPAIGAREETVTELNLVEDSETTPLLESRLDTGTSKTFGSQQIASALAYSLLAFVDIFFVETFPLWAVAVPPSGLGWDAKRIGFCLSITGVISLLCQTMLYPSLSRRYPPLTLYKAPMVGLILIYILFPIIARIAATEYEVWVWPFILVLMAIRTVLDNFTFTSVMVLVCFY